MSAEDTPIAFQPEQIVKIVLDLSDGGDGALPYSQEIRLRFNTGTWDNEVLNVFVASVADAMKDMFGHSRPRVFVRAYQGRQKIWGGKL